MAESQSKGAPESRYWHSQLEAARKDSRYRRWVTVSQQFSERYRLESDGLYMRADLDIAGRSARMIYNLLWSNVQTQLPMLYSKRPEPYVYRRFHSADKIARMAATIAERSVSTDLDQDDFDDQAESCALDYLLTGRGVIRATYEHTTENARVPIRQEDREDGAPAYFNDAGDEIPRDLIESDRMGLFVLDPMTTRERAPLCYHNWQDFLVGPGRKWAEISRNGWICYTTYMSKAEVSKRFGKEAADALNYDYSPFDPGAHKRLGSDSKTLVSSLSRLAIVDEIWDAQSQQIFWVSKGYPGLLDKQPDYLELEGFFNTPRPLLTTYTNDTLLPVPDYAEYHSQATEMDVITSKIEQITEDIRAGGVFNAAVPGLGAALRNKQGGYYQVDDWAGFAEKGGMQGAVQEYLLRDKVDAVAALYQHRQNVKRDADEISGMIDLFRGQQTQKDETLGQSQIRAAMGGLRINDRQRDFQRYIRDCLAMKAEIVTSKFDTPRLLEMADLEALMNESPEITQLRLMIDSPQGQQMLQNPEVALRASAMMEAARDRQMMVINAALAMLKDDQMRTFNLDIETDATVAVDEGMEKAQAGEFVRVVGDFFQKILGSPAVAQSPQLKALSAEMLTFLVRRFKVGRSLEEKIESVLESLVKAPQPQPQPDPLTLDVQRQAKADEQDFMIDQQKNQIDAFEAQTDRMKAQVQAVDAAQKAGREDLRLAKDILEGDEPGVMGNA